MFLLYNFYFFYACVLWFPLPPSRKKKWRIFNTTFCQNSVPSFFLPFWENVSFALQSNIFINMYLKVNFSNVSSYFLCVLRLLFVLNFYYFLFYGSQFPLQKEKLVGTRTESADKVLSLSESTLLKNIHASHVMLFFYFLCNLCISLSHTFEKSYLLR